MKSSEWREKIRFKRKASGFAAHPITRQKVYFPRKAQIRAGQKKVIFI
jgi:hypothetical protein